MPTSVIYTDVSSGNSLLASTVTASSFEVVQNQNSITPESVIFYPEENTVRLMFSSEDASLEEEYSINTLGLSSTDGNVAWLKQSSGYLTNIEDGNPYEFSVMSLSIADSSGKSVSYAKKSANYTVKLVYTNPESTTKIVTVKNGKETLCTFQIGSQESKTLTKSVWIIAGEIFNLSCVVS